MPIDIEALMRTQFSMGGMNFSVDDEGLVRSGDGMDLGHLEECLEEGKAIMDLTEHFETIDFGV